MVRDTPKRYFEVESHASCFEISEIFESRARRIKDLNPGLVPAVFESRMRLPKGYQLRIPYLAETTAESAANVFWAGYETIPKIINPRFLRFVHAEWARFLNSPESARLCYGGHIAKPGSDLVY